MFLHDVVIYATCFCGLKPKHLHVSCSCNSSSCDNWTSRQSHRQLMELWWRLIFIPVSLRCLNTSCSRASSRVVFYISYTSFDPHDLPYQPHCGGSDQLWWKKTTSKSFLWSKRTKVTLKLKPLQWSDDTWNIPSQVQKHVTDIFSHINPETAAHKVLNV